MIWVAAGTLVLVWFVLLIGNVFLGGAIHVLLLAAASLAAWEWLARPRTD